VTLSTQDNQLKENSYLKEVFSFKTRPPCLSENYTLSTCNVMWREMTGTVNKMYTGPNLESLKNNFESLRCKSCKLQS